LYISFHACESTSNDIKGKEKSKMDHPEKLAAQGTQDEEKQNKNTTQQVLNAIVPKTHKQRKEDIHHCIAISIFL
jgi:hypothetical protein